MKRPRSWKSVLLAAGLEATTLGNVRLKSDLGPGQQRLTPEKIPLSERARPIKGKKSEKPGELTLNDEPQSRR